MKSPVKILIVDDDFPMASVLSRNLNKKGFDSKVLDHPEETLKLVGSKSFDLVLLDINMPEMDGLSVLWQLRSKYSASELPIIMVSGTNDSEEILEAFHLGANDYITKNTMLEVAIARINSVINAIEGEEAKAKLREAHAAQAIVITYHHQINNPLTVVKSEIQKLEQEFQIESERLGAIYQALNRLDETMNLIKSATNRSELSYELYANQSKMLSISRAKGEKS